MTSDRIAAERSAKGRPNFKCLHLAGLYSGRAVGAFENLWYPPAEYSQRQDAEVKRSPRLSSTGKDAVYSVVVGHCCFHYPCIRAFPDCLPYSLISTFQRRKNFRGNAAKFRGCLVTASISIPRLFNQTFHLSFRDCGGGYQLISEALQRSLITRPVLPAIYNRWLGCLTK